MTLIDLTNVRDLAVLIDPLDEHSTPVAGAGCCGGACHAGATEPAVDPGERARG